MGGVDLSVFQFDPFLSWSVFLMNADKTIYGRYGQSSPQTRRDRKDSNPHPTLAGLMAALRKGLEIHAAYRKDKKTVGQQLSGKTGPKPRWKFVEKTPSARKYGRLKRVSGSDDEKGCAHCHEVQRTAIDSFFMVGKRPPDRMLWMYPSPHKILGLKFSRDHCARIAGVSGGSAAARAGLKAGDDLLTVQGQPLVSPADVVWVLHTFPDRGGKLQVTLRRGSTQLKRSLKLNAGWRRADDFGWRYRVAGYAMWLWSGATFEDHARGIRVAALSPDWYKKRTNQSARKRLRRGDVIVAVDGRTGWTRSLYIAYLMRDKRLGSEVRLQLLRGGKTIQVKFRLPSKRPEVQGY